MTEVLAGGPPERRRRWSVLLGAAALTASVILTFVHQASSGTPKARPTPTATLSLTPRTLPPDPLPAAAQPQVVVSVVPSPLKVPGPATAAVAGVRSPLPAGIDLVLGGQRLTTLGSRSKELSALGVPAFDNLAVTDLEPLGTGLLATVWNSTPPNGGPPASFYLLRRGDPTVPIGVGNAAFAGADARSVVTIRYGAGPGDGNLVRRLDLRGTVLSQHRVPTSWQLVGDTLSGLVFQDRPSGAGLSRVVLVDPLEFTERRTLGVAEDVVAVGPSRVAWTDRSCEEQCSVVTTDLAGGHRGTWPLGRGYLAATALFSRDAERLAIVLDTAGGSQGARQRPGFVEVVDFSTGRARAVPGVTARPHLPAAVAWTGDGRLLVVAVRAPVATGESTLLGMWSPPTGRLRALAPIARPIGSDALAAL